jgi:hypothetical protein
MSRASKLRNDANAITFSGGAAPSLSTGMMLGAALAVMALILLLAFMIWTETRDLQRDLESRFAAIDNRLAQISTKVDQVSARAAAPAQRGPDPNRVHTVRTDGAPFKGRKDAPITIAEFSDFQ